MKGLFLAVIIFAAMRSLSAQEPMTEQNLDQVEDDIAINNALLDEPASEMNNNPVNPADALRGFGEEAEREGMAVEAIESETVANSAPLPSDTAPLEPLVPQTKLGGDAQAPALLDDGYGFRELADDQGPVVEAMPAPNLFSGAPPVPGTMRNLAVGEAPEEYRVRYGDTLFDICDQLIDEPGYWPKLWALNPFIRNPHFIYPGMLLRFYPGSDTSPPFLQVVTEDDVVPIDKAGLREGELVSQDINGLLTKTELPNRTPVIGADEIQAFPEIDEAFITVGSLFAPKDLSIEVPTFVYADEPEALAVIVGGTAGSFLLDRGQDLIVEEGDKDLAAGELYSVLRPSRRVYHPVTDDFIGYRYEFIGQIKLAKRINEDLHSAAVVFNRKGIQPGDQVLPYRSVKRRIPLQSSANRVAESVVLGFGEPYMEIGGRGSIVVFDNRTAGLKAGQTVKIFQNVKKASTSFIASSLPDFRKMVALAYIFEQSETVALAYVLHDRFEIRIGDDIGAKPAS